MDQTMMRQIALRLGDIRCKLLDKHPFLGRLLMRLNFGLAECGTACTDMRRIVFDPAFVSKLDDKALEFVFLHELMHCVLKHCTRGKGKIHLLYNIACDIVVNSVILDAMGLTDISVGGEKAMHRAPDGKEGRNYTAEQVYKMLLKETEDAIKKKYGKGFFDMHDEWQKLPPGGYLEEMWNDCIMSAGKQAGMGTGIPQGLKRYVEGICHTEKIDWRQELRDYIQFDRFDYTYEVPDKRYLDDIFMPSFQEDVFSTKVDKVWFLIDTSGSVSSVAVSEALEQIKDAINQIGNVCGELSFFDSTVSNPVPFESVEDISKIEPIGNGGTDFIEIFNSMGKYYSEELPQLIIIITDGYATFPEENAAKGVPVIWLIVDSEEKSPWGRCIHIYTDKMTQN